MNIAAPSIAYAPTFVCGDALACLELVASQSVDCVICDPPYGTTQNKWDVVIDIPSMWRELTRVCRGAIVLTAIQPFSSILVASNLPMFRHEWIWEKNKGTGHLNAKRAPMRYHEAVLVFSARPFTFNPQMTDGHKPGNFAKRVTFTPNYGAQRESEPYGGKTVRYPRSVQKFDILNNDSPDRVHPTQKPLALMEYLMGTYSNPGDLVLDFTCGSGTTALAAYRLGRRSLNFEINADYIELARERLKREGNKC